MTAAAQALTPAEIESLATYPQLAALRPSPRRVQPDGWPTVDTASDVRDVGIVDAPDPLPLTAPATPLCPPCRVIGLLGRRAMPRISAGGLGNPERAL